MFLFNYFRGRRRERILRDAHLDDADWQRALNDYNFTRALDVDERARLKQWVILFLAGKPIYGAGNLNIDNGARTRFADMWHGLFLLG